MNSRRNRCKIVADSTVQIHSKFHLESYSRYLESYSSHQQSYSFITNHTHASRIILMAVQIITNHTHVIFLSSRIILIIFWYKFLQNIWNHTLSSGIILMALKNYRESYSSMIHDNKRCHEYDSWWRYVGSWCKWVWLVIKSWFSGCRFIL